MAERLKQTANFWGFQLGLSDKVVRQSLEGVKPDGTRGKKQPLYYLRTVLDAQQIQQRSGDPDELDPTAEKARRDKESADKLALENAETRGDVARVSVMEHELATVFSDLRANALAMPSKQAPLLVGLNADQIRERLEGSVYELLGDFADYRPGRRAPGRPGGDPPGEDDSAPTTKADDKPVVRRKAKTKPRK